MQCVVTAGPTFEPLDDVRRLTNFSTGRLGVELSNHLVDHGHRVTLLLAEQSTYKGPCQAQEVRRFTTTDDLTRKLQEPRGESVGALFHAAAVSDFRFGKVFARATDGNLTEVTSGKFSTRAGVLMAELLPTPKIIHQLRSWFTDALLVGWKYEVEGGKASVTAAGRRQLEECRTNLCVLNGPAYGQGFGLLTTSGAVQHCPDARALYDALLRQIEHKQAS